MNYEDKQEKYQDISKNMHKDLKPIFDRLMEESHDYIDQKNPTDWEEYIPPCGITERNVPLTEEQIREADNMVDQAVTTIMDNPDDFPEIESQVPADQKGEAGTGRGEGKGRVRLIPMEFPEWLEDIETELKDFFVSKKIRKGLDYEEVIKGVIRKGKEKAIQRDNALYVFIDTSNSMWAYKDQYGTPVLKLFSSFFPTIAERYNGQVWFSDYAPLNAPQPITNIIPLSDFRSDDMNQVVIGGMGGTDFWGVWQYFQKQVKKAKEKNEEAKVMMIFFSDMEADFESHPELIGEYVLFVTIKGKGDEVKHLVDGKNRKLIYVDAKPPKD